MSTKRAKDRESGTGNPIKSIAPKGGSGKGNWGSDRDEINKAKAQHNTNDPNAPRRRNREPASFAALNPEDATKEQTSWDDYMKAQGNKALKAEAYNTSTVKSDYRKTYQRSKHEMETDALLFGGGARKKKEKKKRKKKKKLLETQFTFEDDSTSAASRGGGRDYGQRGRGRAYDNMRGGGYQSRGRGRGGGGSYGGGYGGAGYNNRRRGAGFGSRGRGSYNYEFNNQSNYQNQNEYQPNQGAQDNNNQDNNQQGGNQVQDNQDNVNIPVSVQ